MLHRASFFKIGILLAPDPKIANGIRLSMEMVCPDRNSTQGVSAAADNTDLTSNAQDGRSVLYEAPKSGV